MHQNLFLAVAPSQNPLGTYNAAPDPNQLQMGIPPDILQPWILVPRLIAQLLLFVQITYCFLWNKQPTTTKHVIWSVINIKLSVAIYCQQSTKTLRMNEWNEWIRLRRAVWRTWNLLLFIHAIDAFPIHNEVFVRVLVNSLSPGIFRLHGRVVRQKFLNGLRSVTQETLQ